MSHLLRFNGSQTVQLAHEQSQQTQVQMPLPSTPKHENLTRTAKNVVLMEERHHRQKAINPNKRNKEKVQKAGLLIKFCARSGMTH